MTDELFEAEFVNALSDSLFFLSVSNRLASECRAGSAQPESSDGRELKEWLRFLDKKYSKQLASRRKIESPVALFRLQLLGTSDDTMWLANVRAAATGI